MGVGRVTSPRSDTKYSESVAKKFVKSK